MSRERSDELFAEALELLPGGVSSPVRAFKAVGGSPLFIEASSAGTKVLSAMNFISTMSPWPSWAAVMVYLRTGASVALPFPAGGSGCSRTGGVTAS